MENLEESAEVITTTTPDLVEDSIATMESGPPLLAATTHSNELDDSVQIIETPIEVLDLTSPQPSTSTSSTTNCSSGAGAVGAAACAVKRNLEETLKKEANNTDLTCTLDQQPSTSNTAANTASSSSNTTNLLECPICLQTCIHPARLPCGHIFCFLCVKGVAYKNRRCAMCRREIPPEFLDHPQLVNGIEDICTTKATDDGYQWFYEGRNGGWWAYEKRNANEIEEAFQNLCKTQLQMPHKKMKKVKVESFDKDGNRIDVKFQSEEDDDDVNEEGEAIVSNDGNNPAIPLTYDIQICGNIYTVDFQNMLQYPQCMPYRKRKICRAKGLPAKGVAGLLSTKRNRWWQYDDRTSQDLEEAFKKGERSCTILVAGYVYIVDFDAMIQQRQNEPARCRRVKRDLATIPKKGVAGLRIEGNTVTTDSNFAAQVYQSRQNRYRSGELLHEADIDSPDNPILRTHGTNDPASPNTQRRLRLPYGGLGGYVIELGNPSEFVSTAAATDAALRIASDIIGSTLAHADELTRSNSNNTPSTSANAYQNHHLHHHQQHQHTLNQSEETSLNSSNSEANLNDLTHLNTYSSATPVTLNSNTTVNGLGLLSSNSTNGGGVNISRERGSRELLGAAEDLLGATQRVIATADQPTIDLFEQTLNDFHALTLRNIHDSSDDDNDAEQQQQQHQQRQQTHSTPNCQRSSSHSYNPDNP
ncbi:E3 ubiquitin-protein ligase RNF146-B [Lucilia cuprina]|nr:E3 ubiquitin-protein ligase RNF146-B [Lucilia cuprina]KAI8117231.1 E3 ubiquitin-protein ligase RNF146-B [Lucilia cuprina]